jgi:hypothetical protein
MWIHPRADFTFIETGNSRENVASPAAMVNY